MVWASKHSAKFVKPLLRQLMAIVQRDQRAALDWVGGVNILSDIVTYQFSPNTIPQFPAILISPVESIFVQDAVGSVQSANQIFCSLACAHQDNQVLAEMVEDYVRALDAIFNVFPLSDFSDFYTSIPLVHPVLGNIMTDPLDYGTLKELFIVSHGYGEVRRGRNDFRMSATLEIRIDREEI